MAAAAAVFFAHVRCEEPREAKMGEPRTGGEAGTTPSGVPAMEGLTRKSDHLSLESPATTALHLLL